MNIHQNITMNYCSSEYFTQMYLLVHEVSYPHHMRYKVRRTRCFVFWIIVIWARRFSSTHKCPTIPIKHQHLKYDKEPYTYNSFSSAFQNHRRASIRKTHMNSCSSLVNLPGYNLTQWSLKMMKINIYESFNSRSWATQLCQKQKAMNNYMLQNQFGFR